MSSLSEGQIAYLRDVLGIKDIVLPESAAPQATGAAPRPQAPAARGAKKVSTAAPLASNQALAQAQAKAAAKVAPPPSAAGANANNTDGGVKTRGDLAKARLVVLFAQDPNDQKLNEEASDLAEKMVKAMKLGRQDAFWMEWAQGKALPQEVVSTVKQAGNRPVVIFGEETVGLLTNLRSPLGEWLNFEGARLMPTHSPYELLRAPALKKPAWSHLQAVMKVLS